MSAPPSHRTVTDGAFLAESHTRKASASPPSDDICCIYVHAGAGYHSHQNEQIHLEACNDAAQLAMLILRNGGSALDAVEAAVKTLEDREITNAGYGSNLAMDGVVECDAAIVDHHGRSGAVGAVAQIKNPIALARLVHSHTMQSLTLRRVPPNLLVGQGATEFAIEMGMPILPHDALVSPAAKERWIRWRSDLRAAERKGKKSGTHPSCWKVRNDITISDEMTQRRMREQHTQNLLQGQEILDRSPPPSSSDELPHSLDDECSGSQLLPSSENSLISWQNKNQATVPETSDPSPVLEMVEPHSVMESSRSAFINSTQKIPTLSQYKSHRSSRDASRVGQSSDTGSENENNTSLDLLINLGDNARDGSGDSKLPLGTSAKRQPEGKPQGISSPLKIAGTEDHITDTVGAIAIDSWGNIACGASSGGIGMKYRGRVGPAALVGIGAAVIPTDPHDPEQACVATVASGTGEHMATTMAATVCADRLYQSVKKGKGGEYVEVTEDEAIQAMIENDFMGHPSVKNSNSAGAIGVLGVKKLRGGTLLYFGHNTDSFAMASMTSKESVPRCTMSRSNGNGQIAQGGRMISASRNKRAKSTQRCR